MTGVLWLSAETPDVGGGGGQRRQFHQLRALRESGVDVVVASLAGPQSDASVRVLTPVERFGAGPRWRRGIRPTAERVIDMAAPARAIVAHVESAPYVVPVLRAHGVPYLVDFHNVLSRWHEAEGRPVDAARWREREAEALADAAVATASSAEEREALLGLGTGTPVAVAPHGVDPAEWPSTVLPPVREPEIAMFASWSHGPNRVGGEWMAAAVWPEVLAAAPEARLTLLGPGDPPAALTRLPRVDVAGRVDDLAAALGRARVVVVPIRRGMGARVKFVEALASGAAVVSTAEGAEGFEADGAFVEADDPGEFARACSKLVREDTHARALGAKGRERALSRYTWKQVSQPLLAFARGC